MSRNFKISFVAQLGICLIFLYIRSSPQNIFLQVTTLLIAMALYFVFGFNLTNLGSKIKNLFSVSAVSLVCIVLTAICCTIYQLAVINKYHYTFEPFYYIISKFICFTFNGPIMPFATILGNFYSSLKLPYGLLLSFFIPSLMFWLGLEFKSRRRVWTIVTFSKPAGREVAFKIKYSFKTF